jgi:hypothetical protein
MFDLAVMVMAIPTANAARIAWNLSESTENGNWPGDQVKGHKAVPPGGMLVREKSSIFMTAVL